MNQTISRKLEKLWENKELIDLKITVNGHIFEVHKLVLSANSPVFKAMLHNWTTGVGLLNQDDTGVTKIDLVEDPCCVPYFDGFLRFMYGNQVKLNLQNVLPYLILSDKYEVHDLLISALFFMTNNAGNALKNGEIIPWYEYCNASSQPNKQKLENYILWNFFTILESNYFETLPLNLLLRFLNSTQLIITHEQQLKMQLEKWLSSNLEQYSNNELGRLYSVVKTPFLPLSILSDIYSSNNLKFNMSIATKFHTFTGKERKMIKLSRAELALTSPRIYTSELWSTTFVIPNFSKFPRYGVRTEIFSTLSSASRADKRVYWEWILDFYPKGIQYDKSLYISMNKTYEVPGVTINSVQARLTALNNFDPNHRQNYCASKNACGHCSGVRTNNGKNSTLVRKVDVYFLFHTNSAPINNVSTSNGVGLSPNGSLKSLCSTKSPKLTSALTSPHEWNNAISRSQNGIFGAGSSRATRRSSHLSSLTPTYSCLRDPAYRGDVNALNGESMRIFNLHSNLNNTDHVINNNNNDMPILQPLPVHIDDDMSPPIRRSNFYFNNDNNNNNNSRNGTQTLPNEDHSYTQRALHDRLLLNQTATTDGYRFTDSIDGRNILNDNDIEILTSERRPQTYTEMFGDDGSLTNWHRDRTAQRIRFGNTDDHHNDSRNDNIGHVTFSELFSNDGVTSSPGSTSTALLATSSGNANNQINFLLNDSTEVATTVSPGSQEFVSHVVKRENCKFFDDPTRAKKNYYDFLNSPYSSDVMDNFATKKRSLLSDHLYYTTNNNKRSLNYRTNTEAQNCQHCNNCGNSPSSNEDDPLFYSDSNNNRTNNLISSQTSSIKFEDLVPFYTLNYFPQTVTPGRCHGGPCHADHLSSNLNRMTYESILASPNIPNEHDYYNRNNDTSRPFNINYDRYVDGLITRPNSLRVLNNFTPMGNSQISGSSSSRDHLMHHQMFSCTDVNNPDCDCSGTRINIQHDEHLLYLEESDALKVTIVIVPAA